MKATSVLSCSDLLCNDMKRDSHLIPDIHVNPKTIRMIMISESSPQQPSDYYYAGENALFARTTVMAFKDAGAQIHNIQEILALGVYLTTAVKCAKTSYGIKTESIERCSHLLETELALFPEIKVIMLMGDVAIKSLNFIAKRNGHPRVIPAGSTYKIRSGVFTYNGIRVFPSYLQAGPSFFIEKSKRKMIAEDITQALQLI